MSETIRLLSEAYADEVKAVGSYRGLAERLRREGHVTAGVVLSQVAEDEKRHQDYLDAIIGELKARRGK